MSTFRCPHCSVMLSATELKEGWCEKCGKHVPEHLLSAAAKEDRQHRHDHLTHKQAPLPTVAEPRVGPAEDKDLEPATPLPTGMIRRVAGIALTLLALATMIFPWSSGKDPRTEYEIEQSGLQMVYGGTTIRPTGTSKASDLERVKKEHYNSRDAKQFILGFPVCLLLALGTLLLLEPAAGLCWAAAWGTLAVVFVLMQLAVSKPPGDYFSPVMWIGLTASFLMVMVCIWPTRPAPEAGLSGWSLAAPMLLFASALYAGSFFITMISLDRTQPTWTAYPSLSEEVMKEPEQIGAETFHRFYVSNLQCWYANPVGWMAWLLLLCRRWLWASLAAGMALWLSVTYFLFAKLAEQGHGCALGYWVWVGSFAVLLIGSLVGWVMGRMARK